MSTCLSPLSPFPLDGVATTWASKSSTRLYQCTVIDFALARFEHAFQCIHGQRAFAPLKSDGRQVLLQRKLDESWRLLFLGSKESEVLFVETLKAVFHRVLLCLLSRIGFSIYVSYNTQTRKTTIQQ